MKPRPPDSSGRILGLMLKWRQQRKAALQAEIARLDRQLAVQSGTTHKATAEEELVAWIVENGGQVGVHHMWKRGRTLGLLPSVCVDF